jgi:hypothetical protein
LLARRHIDSSSSIPNNLLDIGQVGTGLPAPFKDISINSKDTDMGVDTKGFVATNCKDVFFVVGLAEEALNNLIRPHARAARFNGQSAEDPPKFRTVDARLHASSEGVHLNFTYEGEVRTLHMYFTCDCDNTEYTPASISLSLGCWGQSELYMKAVLQALSPLGDVYFDLSDCDDIEPAKLEDTPLTFISACVANVESAFPSNLATWKRLFDAGQLRTGTCEEVLGLPRSKVDRLTSIPWRDAHEELTAMHKEAVAAAADATATAIA